MKNLQACLLASLLVAGSAQADIWAEREALAKIETEIAALESLVAAAQAQSDPGHRTTFAYRVLLDDLQKIREGIAHHLTVPMEPVIPSSIDALASDYTEVKHQ